MLYSKCKHVSSKGKVPKFFYSLIPDSMSTQHYSLPQESFINTLSSHKFNTTTNTLAQYPIQNNLSNISSLTHQPFRNLAIPELSLFLYTL